MKMKMKMKTVYYLLLGLCLATAACKPDEPEVPKPEEPKDEIISGTCGENLTWSYNKTKAILTISGTGEMKNYSLDTVAPWEAYKKEFQTVIIEDGVTSIGNLAFCENARLTQVTIGSNVASIGEKAFYSSPVVSIRCKVATPPVLGNECFSETPLKLIFIPTGTTDGYTKAWGNEYTYIEEGSEVELTVHVEYGGLGSAIIDKGYMPAQVTKLTVTGTLVHEDFFFINSDMPRLYNLDISGITNTTLPRMALLSNESIMQIILPNSLTSIEYGTFGDCKALTLVVIPNSVKDIGGQAFVGCKALTQITIPDSVVSIGESAFRECSALTQVTIGNGVTSIGNLAFWKCSALTQVNIPGSVTSIGGSAFESTALFDNAANWTNNVLYIDNCLIAAKTELSGNYEIAAGTRVIANGAFYYHSSLTQVTIPESVTSIGDRAFAICRALTAIQVVAANTAYSSENGVLFNMNKTTLIQYPAGKSETTYTIPDGVVNIGTWAFSDCNTLTQVTLPESVTNIEYNAFYACSALTEMTVLATVPPMVGSNANNAFDGVSREIPVYVPAEALEAYQAAEGWKEFTNLQAIQ